MIHARDDYNRIQDPENKIPENEPVLLVRGQDQAAIPTIIAWMKAHLDGGGSVELVKLLAKHILRISDWQENHCKKVADLPHFRIDSK